MSTLAHVFEAAGLATIVLSSVLGMVQKVAPPRALHCEFPLGRPLGKPLDPQFQHDVLRRAFALLDAPSGPVLEIHPEEIVADEEPMACAIPPRFDPGLPPAVDEARGIRKAFDRSLADRGSTSVGRVMSPDEVPDVLVVFHLVAEGTPWTDVEFPQGDPRSAAQDVRTYYEEAALKLADGPPPGGRQVEAWFFERTEAGKVVMAARQAMKAAKAPFPPVVLHGAWAPGEDPGVIVGPAAGPVSPRRREPDRPAGHAPGGPG